MHTQPCHRLLPLGGFHGHATKIQHSSNIKLIGSKISFPVNNRYLVVLTESLVNVLLLSCLMLYIMAFKFALNEK